MRRLHHWFFILPLVIFYAADYPLAGLIVGFMCWFGAIFLRIIFGLLTGK